jgi:hypothetical protein
LSTFINIKHQLSRYTTMMNQEDIFKKIGQIINELNEQYQYLAQNPAELNELELELFLANSTFLSDHVQIVRKLNSRSAQKALPEHGSPAGELIEQQPVIPVKIVEPPHETEAQTHHKPVIEEEIFKIDKEPSTFEFILNEKPSTDRFEFEEKSIDEIFDRPLSKEEEQIIAQKQKLRELDSLESELPEEDEIGPEPFLVSSSINPYTDTEAVAEDNDRLTERKDAISEQAIHTEEDDRFNEKKAAVSEQAIHTEDDNRFTGDEDDAVDEGNRNEKIPYPAKADVAGFAASQSTAGLAAPTGTTQFTKESGVMTDNQVDDMSANESDHLRDEKHFQDEEHAKDQEHNLDEEHQVDEVRFEAKDGVIAKADGGESLSVVSAITKPEEEKPYHEPVKPTGLFSAPNAADEKPVAHIPEEQPKTKPTLNDILSGNANTKSFGAASSRMPVTDLKQAISLNDKMRYIKDLFNGYNLAYAEAIDLLNKMPDFKTADAFLQNNYAGKNNWAAKQETAEQFYELLNQRFPAK